jgi:hypothetical protein
MRSRATRPSVSKLPPRNSTCIHEEVLQKLLDFENPGQPALENHLIDLGLVDLGIAQTSFYGGKLGPWLGILNDAETNGCKGKESECNVLQHLPKRTENCFLI